MSIAPVGSVMVTGVLLSTKSIVPVLGPSLLGAALALEVSGRESSGRAGVQRAAQAIDSGAAARLLAALAQFGQAAALEARAQPVVSPP